MTFNKPMLARLKNRRTLLIVILLVIVLIFLLVPKPAAGRGVIIAGGSNTTGARAVESVAKAAGNSVLSAIRGVALFAYLLVLWLIGWSFAFIYSLFSFFLDFIYQQNLTVMQFGTDTIAGQVIPAGFEKVLSVANLGFVFAIIFIAFATIFRSQTYGMKQMLWKLVVAAVAVNFSLLIAGTAVDFTNVLTQKLAGTQNLGASISKTINPQTLLGGIQPRWIGTDSFTEMATLGVAATFTAVFIAIFAVVMIAVGIMLTVRYLYIVILLILMPLAWLMWVTPRFTHLFKQWWDKFFQQLFYLPAVIFFIKLAMDINVAELNSLTGFSAGVSTSGVSGDALTNTLKYVGMARAIGQSLLNQVVIIGLLIGSLIVAQKMGGAGANMAMGFAKGVKNKVGKPALRFVAKPITEPIKRGGRAVARGLGQAMNFKGAASAVGGWMPKSKGGKALYVAGSALTLGLPQLLKGAARGVSGAGAALVGAGEGGIKDAKVEERNFSKQFPTSTARKAGYQASVSQTPDKIAGAILTAIKEGERGDLQKAYSGNEDKVVSAAKSYGISSELAEAWPELAPKLYSGKHEKREDAREELRDIYSKPQLGNQLEEIILGHTPYDEVNEGIQKEGDQVVFTDEVGQERIARHGGEGIVTIHEAVREEREPTEEDVDRHLVTQAGAKASQKVVSENWTKETLANPDVVSGMNIGQVKAVGREGDSKSIEALKGTLDDLNSVMKRVVSGQASASERARIASLSSTQLKRLSELVRYAKSNPTFVSARDYTGRKRGGGGEKSEKDDSDDDSD